MKVLILGAGGHGQVVADIFLAGLKSDCPDIQPIGFLDDDPSLQQCSFLGLPVLGDIPRLPSIAHDAVIVAVGDNSTRREIFQQLHSKGERFVSAIHPSAIIAEDVEIGEGTMICAGVVVNPGSRIGRGVILNTACTVGHHSHIGDYVHVAPGAHLGGEVGVGEGTLIGLGANVLSQRQIGPWATVGAGALVVKDVPPFVTVAGVPANVIKDHPVEKC